MTAKIRRVLVLGGYGAFGGRLVELLGADANLEVLVAGRSFEKARLFCAALETEATLEPVTVDRDGNIGEAFDKFVPDLVVDASGPFQSYGDDPYRVVVAAITRGIHYADLADDAGFVRGIAQFNAAASRAGVFALSGLSTCPALTAAAVRRLSGDLTQVDAIVAGIAPSPAADVGESVVRAVAAYAGKPIQVRVASQTCIDHALVDHRDATIGLAGGLPLFRRRFSLVEVPDLMLLHDCFPGVRDVWVGAAIAPPLLHRALTGMARLVRWRLLPSLVPFARLMHRASNLFTWGEHRGGMFVSVSGWRAPATRIERSWNLVADGSRGPYVPTMAAAAVIHRCNNGRVPVTGARPATGELEMKDFDRFFDSLGLEHDVRFNSANSANSLYQRVLGNAWLDLPDSVRRIHGDTSTRKWRGRARVTRASNTLAKLIGTLFRFPKAGDDIGVTVEFHRKSGRETWTRNFAGRRFSSVQYQGRGAYEGLLCERFGPFTFGLATVVENDRLRVPVRRWSMLGVRLPLWLAPRSNTYECEEDGTFQFYVDISLPLVGLVVRYEGYINEEVPVAGNEDRVRRTAQRTSPYNGRTPCSTERRFGIDRRKIDDAEGACEEAGDLGSRSRGGLRKGRCSHGTLSRVTTGARCLREGGAPRRGDARVRDLRNS